MSREATRENRVRSSTLPVILIIVLLLGFAILGAFLVLKTVGETWILDEVSRRDIARGKGGVVSLTARMDRMEMLAEIVGQAGQSQGSRAQILSIVENLHGDPSIEGIRSFGYFRNITGESRPQFYYRFTVRNGIQPDPQPPTAEVILHALLPYARTQHCLWQLNTESGGRRFDGITCTLPIIQNNAVVGAAVLELHPDAFQDLVLELQAEVGYAFLVDETNRFVTFSYPDSVRLVDLNSEEQEILETVTVQDMAGRDARFAAIADALVSINRQLVNNAAGNSDYDADILEKLKAHDAATIGDRAQMLMTILMDPLKTEGGGPSDAGMLQRQLRIGDDFILGESALVYVFH
ncbi:MAG: hypothetical protein KDK30_11190, partial [Leptospiraceae bacterium]|nr:hypothetical protein [Leptospiraceae bacterium]